MNYWSEQARKINTNSNTRSNLVKLTTLFMIPLIVFIYMSSIQITKLSNQAQQLTKLKQLTLLAISLSSLLHELQKERGYTSVYLTGNEQDFLNQLIKQQQLTDSKQEILFTEIDRRIHKVDQVNFNESLNIFKQQLLEIRHYRHKVISGAIDSLAAIEFYSELNKNLLNIIADIVKLTVKTELTQAFFSYISFLNAKEMTGIERATLGVVFSNNEFSPANHHKQIELATAQSLYQKEFLLLASGPIKQSFIDLQSNSSFRQVKKLHNIAQLQSINKATKVDVKLWFNIISQKINLLQQLEQQISKELLTKSKLLKRVSIKEMWVWKIALVLIIVVLTIAGFILIRNINQKNINFIIEAANKNQLLLSENRKLSQRNYQVQEQERKQLAAELHDQCGQQLTGIKLHADFISHYITNNIASNNQTLTSAAEAIANSSRLLINGIRTITNDLRPIMLDQFGLAEAINELLQQWQKIMPQTHFTLINNCPDVLEEKLAIGCFRIIQEALTNSCKHAKAKNIEVSITIRNIDKPNHAIEQQSFLKIAISDDGIGLSKLIPKSGLGLISMRERTEALNGKFILSSGTNQGVRIFISLPIIIKNKELLKQVI